MKKICKCCGKYELDKESLYEVCPICGWESDQVQEDNPDMEGGANKLSLNQYKRKYKMNKFEGYYDGPPIIPEKIKNMSIEELDEVLKKFDR